MGRAVLAGTALGNLGHDCRPVAKALKFALMECYKTTAFEILPADKLCSIKAHWLGHRFSRAFAVEAKLRAAN
jgi:hypothetical protein